MKSHFNRSLLRKLRRKSGWTQRHVATLLNITDQSVSDWECADGRIPPLGRLMQLAELFKIDVTEFFTEGPEKLTAKHHKRLREGAGIKR